MIGLKAFFLLAFYSVFGLARSFKLELIPGAGTTSTSVKKGFYLPPDRRLFRVLGGFLVIIFFTK